MNFEHSWNSLHDKWKTFIKSRIKALVKEGILSIQAAACQFEVFKLMIHNWMHVEWDQHSHIIWTEWSSKLNKWDCQHLICIVTALYEGWRLKWKELSQLTEMNVSEKTIKQACAKKKYHKCKTCWKLFFLMKNCQIWRHFARVYSRVRPNFWWKIMWSDECSFDMSRDITK